jgi:hypothetical protein
MTWIYLNSTSWILSVFVVTITMLVQIIINGKENNKKFNIRGKEYVIQRTIYRAVKD